jgi:sugar lactone lactonase YvrE
MPRDGGPERREIEKVRNRNYAVGQSGIWFERETEPSRIALSFYSFATGKVSELYRTLRPTHNGLAVSPDERWLLFTQVDQEGSDLMVADKSR